jgi:hypothetical protein
MVVLVYSMRQVKMMEEQELNVDESVVALVNYDPVWPVLFEREATNESDRLLYERTKRDLAARSWKNAQHYADAKTAVVEEIFATHGINGITKDLLVLARLVARPAAPELQALLNNVDSIGSAIHLR